MRRNRYGERKKPRQPPHIRCGWSVTEGPGNIVGRETHLLPFRGLNFIRGNITSLAYVNLPSWHRLEIVDETCAEAKEETRLAYRSTIFQNMIICGLPAWQARIKIAHGYFSPLSPPDSRGWARVIKSFQSFAVKSFFRTYLRYGKVPPPNNDIPCRVTYRALISSQLITGRKVGVAGEFVSMCSVCELLLREF